MARDSDSYGDGTRPFDASFGDATSGGPVERDAAGFLGDDSVRLDLANGPSVDSTAYAMPVGDPFQDALAVRLPEWSDSALTQEAPAAEQPDDRSDEDPTRERQQPSPPVQPAPAPARQSAPARQPAPAQQPAPIRQPAPAQRPAAPRQQRPPAPPRPRNQANRGAPPPAANRGAPPRNQPVRRPASTQPPANQSAARRPANPPPAARQGAKSAYPLTLDDLTKRPPIGRQQPSRRPKAGPRRTNSMARFPGGPGERAAPVERSAPARRARNIRPIVPIVLFVVILVGLIRGCANARDKSDAPHPDTVYSLTR